MKKEYSRGSAGRAGLIAAVVLLLVSLFGTSLAEEPAGTEKPEEGWEFCKESLTDWTWTGVTEQPRENGSKEIAADSYEIYRYIGTPRDSGNVFTAFDEDDAVIGYLTFADSMGLYEFICPLGTTKLTVPAEAGNPDAPSVLRRTTGLMMAVMGDSISSFVRYVPAGNKVYYLGYNCDVPSAGQLWWGITARELGYRISVIDAWSGSLVSTALRPEASMCTEERTSGLDLNGTPDIIIIYGGVNDFLEGIPLGEWNGKAMPESGAAFREAYALMLDRILRNYPLARVYCCTLAACDRNYVPFDLENLEGQYLYEFNGAIREIAGMFHCEVIDLSACGITAYNLETYMGDFDPDNSCALHPNWKGQELIARKVIKALEQP